MKKLLLCAMMACFSLAMYASDVGFEPPKFETSISIPADDCVMVAAPSVEYTAVTVVSFENWMVGITAAAFEVKPIIGVPAPKLQPASIMGMNVYNYHGRICAPPNANRWQLRSLGNIKYKRHSKLS